MFSKRCEPSACVLTAKDKRRQRMAIAQTVDREIKKVRRTSGSGQQKCTAGNDRRVSTGLTRVDHIRAWDSASGGPRLHWPAHQNLR